MQHRSICVIALMALFLFTVAPSPAFADCTSVVVGRKASADGSVLLGHNEDNGGRIVMPQYVVPRMTHEPGEVIRFENGGTTPQRPVTWGFIWSQTPGGSFSDFFVNEWGVAVASDNCGSTREDDYDTLVANGGITDGGIGYHIRRIIAERATTAREGVEIAAGLVEEFGYIAGGRSYQICDFKEGWLMHIVRGKHYVAQRVPDDQVVIIPNCYVIREVDLNDKENFIASPDLVDYAVARGWYDPASGESFDFAAAYNTPPTGKSLERGYDTRQWMGQKLITGVTPSTTPLPFAVTPGKKMAVADVMAVLSNHYEETEYDKTDGYKASPHWTDERVICTSSTQESSVTVLRDGVPDPIKAVYWRTNGRPCASPYIPWYLGMTSVPEGYSWMEPKVGNSIQFAPHNALYDYDSTKAWWVFQDLQNAVDGQYGKAIGRVQQVWKGFQDEIFAEQPAVDAIVARLAAVDEQSAKQFVTQYTNSLTTQAAAIAKELTRELVTADLHIEAKAIRLAGEGVFTASLLSSETFDAGKVSYADVAIGPGYRNPSTWAPANNGKLADVNGDGRLDLVMEFSIPAMAKIVGVACYTDVWLRAVTDSGEPVVARGLADFMK